MVDTPPACHDSLRAYAIKCNVIWAVCFFVMTCIAILFFVLYVTKISTEVKAAACALMEEQACKDAKDFGCEWDGKLCKYVL